MAMVAHERSLVKKLEGKPFVLLGVNCDDNDQYVKEKNQKEQITWRSFKNLASDGRSISAEWNVRGLPTVYLIDHKGIIRQKWEEAPDAKKMEEAIAKAVAEAEKDQKK
jgi:peroxiredoxin